MYPNSAASALKLALIYKYRSNFFKFTFTQNFEYFFLNIYSMMGCFEKLLKKKKNIVNFKVTCTWGEMGH